MEIEIDKIYYELLREREEKIREEGRALSVDPQAISDAIQITEHERTRYMIKASAIFLYGQLK